MNFLPGAINKSDYVCPTVITVLLITVTILSTIAPSFLLCMGCRTHHNLTSDIPRIQTYNLGNVKLHYRHSQNRSLWLVKRTGLHGLSGVLGRGVAVPRVSTDESCWVREGNLDWSIDLESLLFTVLSTSNCVLLYDEIKIE